MIIVPSNASSIGALYSPSGWPLPKRLHTAGAFLATTNEEEARVLLQNVKAGLTHENAPRVVALMRQTAGDSDRLTNRTSVGVELLTALRDVGWIIRRVDGDSRRRFVAVPGTPRQVYILHHRLHHTFPVGALALVPSPPPKSARRLYRHETEIAHIVHFHPF